MMIYIYQKGLYSVGLILTPETNQSSWGESEKSCWFVSMACPGLIQLVCFGFKARIGSFLSSHGRKHPDPKSSRDLDPDKR